MIFALFHSDEKVPHTRQDLKKVLDRFTNRFIISLKHANIAHIVNMNFIRIKFDEPNIHYQEGNTGPAKWVSKWRGHGTLKSIIGLDG